MVSKSISEYMSEQGRKGRAVNSEAQQATARANGAKGGRPPIDPDSIILVRECAPAYKSQRTTAKIVRVAGQHKDTPSQTVYRTTEFCLEGEAHGWTLLEHEYKTLAGLLTAAKRIGCTVEKREGWGRMKRAYSQ